MHVNSQSDHKKHGNGMGVSHGVLLLTQHLLVRQAVKQLKQYDRIVSSARNYKINFEEH